MKLAAAAIIIALLVIGAFGTDYYLGLRAIQASDHKWCSSMQLLTSGPEPSAKTPQARKLWTDFEILKHRLGC